MKTKKPLDNIIIFISPTCVHCHNLIKSLPLDVFEKMKIVNSTKVSKRVQEKIPHVPYIVDKNGKPLKVKGKITYEKLMRFSNSFGENIEKYKKVPTPRPKGNIRMKRPFGPSDNKSLKNKFGRPASIKESKVLLRPCKRKFGRPASIKESKALLRPCKRKFGQNLHQISKSMRPCKRKFGRPSLGKIMSKNNAGYRKPIIKPGDTISISTKGGKIKVKKES
tara:strand:+ start:5461 stop:6126 length:666 start_codon:yes stop_codon:yes gene_type:complete